MTIKEVKDKKDAKAFIKLPYSIYKDDKNWIPHIRQDVEDVFNPDKNKLFKSGSACRWLLIENGVVIGRIAAFVNKRNKEHISGFGFFECIDNQDAAFKLFDTAKEWLLNRGQTFMDGPINFGEKDKFWGLIIQNFDHAPYYGQYYNPKRYVAYFENYGLQRYYEQIVYHRTFDELLQPKFVERAERLESTPGYSVRCADMKNLDKVAKDFRIVYNRAWGKREAGFSEMSQAQADTIMKKLKPIMDPELIHFAYYEDKPIGFYVSLPELNQIFKKLNGNLNLLGKLKFLYYKKKGICTTSFGIVFGIDPDFQGKGVEGMIFNNLGRHIQPKMKYKDIVITWIGDFNPKMMNIIESLGTTILRKMATYRIHFDSNIEFKRKPIVNISKKVSSENTEN